MNTKTIFFIILSLTVLSIFLTFIYFKIPTEEMVEEVGIRDVRGDSSDFFCDLTTYFYVVSVRPRPDPEKWLLEEYYIVTIRDNFGNQTDFVICSSLRTTYQQYVGEKAKFFLQGVRLAELLVGFECLFRNILIAEPVDPEDISLGYYMIKIYLIHNNTITLCSV